MMKGLLFALMLLQGTWEQEPAFAKPITVRADAEPVHVLVKKLAEATGKELLAHESVAQDRIILFATKTPAHEVMKKISDHFGWEWRQTEDGLQLWQTPSEKATESKQMREIILQPYRRIRDAARGRREVLTHLDRQEQIQGLMRLLRERHEFVDKNPSRNVLDDPVARQARSAKLLQFDNEITSAAMTTSPTWLLFDGVLATLDDDDLWSLDRSSRLVFADRPTKMQRELPDSVRNLVNEIRDLGQTVPTVAVGEAGADLHTALQTRPRVQFSAHDVASVRLEIRRYRAIDPSRRLTRTVVGNVAVLGPGGQVLYSGNFSDNRDFIPNPSPRPVNVPGDPRLHENLRVSTAFLAANEPGATHMTKLCDRLLQEMWQKDSRLFPQTARAIQMNELAGCLSLNLISDCLDYPAYHASPLPTKNGHLAIEALARIMSSSTGLEGKWLTFRKESWQLWRSETYPAESYFRIRDIALQEFTLDGAAEIAVLSTDYQATDTSSFARLLQKQTGFFMGMNEHVPYVLRFVHSLSKPMRENLASGGSVHCGDLTPAQREVLWAALYRADSRRPRAISSMTYSLDEFGKKWLAQFREPDRNKDEDATQLLPHGLPQEARIQLQDSDLPGLELRSKTGAKTEKLDEARVVTGGYYKPAENPYFLRTTTFNRHFFSFDAGEDRNWGALFQGYGRSSAQQHDRFEDLPKEVRDRLEEIKKRRNLISGGG